MYSKKHLSILGLVVAAALVFHGSALYMVHGLSVNTHTAGVKGFVENQRDLSPPVLKDKEEIQRKSELLSNIFKNIQTPPAETQHTEYDLKDVKPEFSEVVLKSTPAVPKENVLESPSFEMHEDLSAFPTKELPENELAFDENQHPHPTSMDIVFPEALNISNDMLRAANVRQGSLEMEHPDLIEAAMGVKVGHEALQESLLDEDALYDRSGMIDLGSSDSLIGSLPVLTDSSEVSYIKHEAYPNHQLQNELSPLPSNNSQMADLAILPSHLSDSQIEDLLDVATVASSNDFTLEVEYTASQEQDGYLFCIKFLPKKEVSFKRIRQNIFFLIDRSHSISKDRYDISKQAVLNSLELLNPKDTFNILIFDDKVVRLAKNNLPWNQQSLRQAKDFLSKQSYGGFFASTDLYTSLGDIVPDAVANTEVNTVILLSDGDTYMSKDNQRKSIAKWTNQNAGKVSLFSIAAGKGNNLSLLDLLSSFNKGSLRYAQNNKDISKTLMTLLKGIQNPIGKDITASVILPDSSVQVTLYPSSNRSPDLYEQTPYVIYGKISDLKDFYVFLQGKYYDKSLDIKQTVSFTNAKRVARRSLEKTWALQKAYDAYEAYLIDGKQGHLIQAQRLLTPFKIPLAFQ